MATAATLVTLVLSMSVLSAPTRQVFGLESVGRHHDPFTVMQQIDRPFQIGIYSQPVTDLTGRVLARAVGPVAGYNGLILLSFPLSAAAAFLLARHLSLTRTGAAIAAFAFAFSPFHLAHAAYHPHIAQTQWLALYLLALWRCLDAATPKAVAWLGAATVAVTLSNFYGGFIAAAITPIAMAGYWLAARRAGQSSPRTLVVTAASLSVLAGAGLAYAALAANLHSAEVATYSARASDLLLYSATWWSYLMPPVAHPLFGAAARRVWAVAGVGDGLLEQQVGLGWGIMILALVAIAAWVARDRGHRAMAAVPVLVAVAAVAFVCSLSPEATVGTLTFTRPSAWLYEVAPMFRSYARFGVVVQLMVAILAGIGVDRLRRFGTWRAKAAATALLLIAGAEYAVSPLAASRDVLPTQAHRWVMGLGRAVRVLDCTRPGPDAAALAWLTEGRVSLLGGVIDDCGEPALGAKLAAYGYTHVLIRGTAADAPWAPRPVERVGLQVAATFQDGLVYVVAAARPLVYTAAITGFFPRERDPDWSWRWMGADAAWTVVNLTPGPVVATLNLEVSAFHRDRRLHLLLDRHLVRTIVVAPARSSFRIGPLSVPPGSHTLGFSPAEPPTVADEVIHNRDPRRLSVAVGTWLWTVDGPHP